MPLCQYHCRTLWQCFENRQFLALMHQIAPNCIIKIFPGVTSRTPIPGEWVTPFPKSLPARRFAPRLGHSMVPLTVPYNTPPETNGWIKPWWIRRDIFRYGSRFAARYYSYIALVSLHSSTCCRWLNTLYTMGQCCCTTEGIYIWLRQDYCISRRRRKGSMSNRKVLRQKKRQIHLEERKQGQCGLGNGWLEDMSSDIMISYWQNSTRKIPRLCIHASALVAEKHYIGLNDEFPWHAWTRTVPQRWCHVSAVLTHCSRKWHEIDACHKFWNFQNSLYHMARTPAHFTHCSRSFPKTFRNGTLRSVQLRGQNASKCQCSLCFWGCRCLTPVHCEEWKHRLYSRVMTGWCVGTVSWEWQCWQLSVDCWQTLTCCCCCCCCCYLHLASL